MRRFAGASLLVALALFGAGAAASGGTVTHLLGTLSVKKADGSVRILSRKSTIESGDTLVTERDSFAQVEFADGARLTLKHGDDAVVEAAFSFCHEGVPCWDIDVETDKGALRLSAGGSKLLLNGSDTSPNETHGAHVEYEPVYRRFARLIERGQSDVDKRPFQLVADAFLICKRHTVEPFIE